MPGQGQVGHLSISRMDSAQPILIILRPVPQRRGEGLHVPRWPSIHPFAIAIYHLTAWLRHEAIYLFPSASLER